MWVLKRAVVFGQDKAESTKSCVVHRACGLGFRPGFRYSVLSFVGGAQDLGVQKVTTSKNKWSSCRHGVTTPYDDPKLLAGMDHIHPKTLNPICGCWGSVEVLGGLSKAQNL